MVTVTTPTVEGLAGFFAAYRAAAQPASSLASFLSSYHQLRERLLATQAETPQRPALSPAAMADFLSELHTHCVAYRSTDRLTNIWAVAGLRRDEVRTTSVLAWMLNSRADHGYGNGVLDALLRRIADRLPGGLCLGPDYIVRTEFCAFGDRSDRIDIAIEDESCVVFLEAKIDAPEGPEQLKRYVARAQERAAHTGRSHWCVLFLSPARHLTVEPGVIPIGWDDIAAAIAEAIRQKGSPGTFSSQAFQQFALHVGQLQGVSGVSGRAQ